MREKIFNILKILLCLVFFFSFSYISRFFLKIFGVSYSNFSVRGEAIYQFVASILIFILVLFVYFDKFKNDFIYAKKNIGSVIRKIFLYFIIFMIIKYIVSFISVIICMILGYDVNSITSVNQDMIESYVKTYPLLMTFSAAIFAPFYEEGIFRLGFKKAIKNKWLFIIISGSIFGLMHVFPLEQGVTLAVGLIQSITYVTMGIVFSFIYYKTDNIYYTIGIHLLNNLISILVMINLF